MRARVCVCARGGGDWGFAGLNRPKWDGVVGVGGGGSANVQGSLRQGGVLITGCMHFVKCRTINLGNDPFTPIPQSNYSLFSLHASLSLSHRQIFPKWLVILLVAWWHEWWINLSFEYQHLPWANWPVEVHLHNPIKYKNKLPPKIPLKIEGCGVFDWR